MTISGVSEAALSRAQEHVNGAVEGVRQAASPAARRPDSVELSQQAVRLLVARRSYDAAIELAKVSDRLVQTTIDQIG